MKAVLASSIGKVALGAWNERCLKAPVDKNQTNRQGRHERVVLGEMTWETLMLKQFQICDHCGEPFYVSTGTTQYDTPSGELEPGCLFWDDNLPEDFFWDNHKGPHLNAVLPSGARWNIDSRASNCNRQNDRTTRCWRRTGTPPNVHTADCGCGAGAGSIWAGKGTPQDWHGFLHNGEFKKC